MKSALVVAVLLPVTQAQNMTRMMIDSIARMVDGSVQGVDDQYFEKLVECMGRAENLVASHDAAWAGFKVTRGEQWTNKRGREVDRGLQAWRAR